MVTLQAGDIVFVDPSFGDDMLCASNRSVACASLTFALAQARFSAKPRTAFVLAPGSHFILQLVFRTPLQKIMGLSYQRYHDANALPNFSGYYVRRFELRLSTNMSFMCIVWIYDIVL